MQMSRNYGEKPRMVVIVADVCCRSGLAAEAGAPTAPAAGLIAGTIHGAVLESAFRRDRAEAARVERGVKFDASQTRAVPPSATTASSAVQGSLGFCRSRAPRGPLFLPIPSNTAKSPDDNCHPSVERSGRCHYCSDPLRSIFANGVPGRAFGGDRTSVIPAADVAAGAWEGPQKVTPGFP